MEAQPIELIMHSAFSGRDPENNTADDKRMFSAGMLFINDWLFQTVSTPQLSHTVGFT